MSCAICEYACSFLIQLALYHSFINLYLIRYIFSNETSLNIYADFTCNTVLFLLVIHVSTNINIKYVLTILFQSSQHCWFFFHGESCKTSIN